MADISSTEEASPAGAKPMPSAAERDPFAFDEDDAPPANRSTMRSRLPVKRRAVASDESAPHESPHVAPSPERTTAGGSDATREDCDADLLDFGGEALSRQLLEHSLRALVNLTHSSHSGCTAVIGRGLPLTCRVVAMELGGSDSRDGLASHYDTALMAIGVLTNCLEMCPREAANVGNVLCRVGAETTEGKASSEASGGSSSASSSTASSSTADTASASSLICVLSKALRHLLVPLPADVDANGASSDQPAGDGDAAFAAAQRAAEAAEAREQRAMEREFSAAYIALLIGFICKGQPTHATTALKELHEPTFARIGALLRGFLDLQASANLISGDSAKTMATIIDWMDDAQ